MNTINAVILKTLGPVNTHNIELVKRDMQYIIDLSEAVAQTLAATAKSHCEQAVTAIRACVRNGMGFCVISGLGLHFSGNIEDLEATRASIDRFALACQELLREIKLYCDTGPSPRYPRWQPRQF